MAINVTLTTNRGPIHLRLHDDKTPVTVASFVNLARRGYYNGLKFHRVIADFMIQGGCPEGSGRGGPGYRFAAELNPSLKHDKPGVLAMANAGPRTNGSQFFITYAATPHLNDRHTIFGEVSSGLDVTAAIRNGDTIDAIEILDPVQPLLEAQAERVQQWNKQLGK
jgi:peptidyl-prolyl cis-trans isomerase B (cyclophilin B)